MPRQSVEISESYTALTSKHEPTPLPEGERRRATILFSDLSGYTEMNERLDPESGENNEPNQEGGGAHH